MMGKMEENIVKFILGQIKKNKKNKFQESDGSVLPEISISQWIYDASEKISKNCIKGKSGATTHNAKYTHPDVSVIRTNFALTTPKLEDGYLRSSSIELKSDMVGNAVLSRYFKFLSLNVIDKQTLLDCFESNNDELKKIIEKYKLDFESIRSKFLLVKSEMQNLCTDNLLKQVYFPVCQCNENNEQYHLLTLLTPPGLISELKNRIELMYDKTKEKQNSYSKLINLVKIKYGGKHPQNIGMINQNDGGTYYLLPCIPMKFKDRTVRLPRTDFFEQSIFMKGQKQKEKFQQLNKLITNKKSNKKIRETIILIIRDLIDYILYIAFKIRNSFSAGWSLDDNYVDLPENQKIWLDDKFIESRNQNDDWRDDIGYQIALKIIQTYEFFYKNDLLSDDDDLFFIEPIVMKKIQECKEFF